MIEKAKRESKKSNKTRSQLALLLLIFMLGFLGQAMLNYSFNQNTIKLDRQLENSKVENQVAQNVLKYINQIHNQFLQLATYPNKHLQRIIKEKIKYSQKEVYEYFQILNEGGEFELHLDLNLAHTEELEKKFTFTPSEKDRFTFIKHDIENKFVDINNKVDLINSMLNKQKLLIEQKSPKLSEIINQIKLEFKFMAPLFVRLKENANQVFYLNIIETLKLEQIIKKQKQFQFKLQIIITLLALLLGLFLFWRLSKNIHQTTEVMIQAKDYTQDILYAQKNIIVVNDGKKILDVSGGFHDFFPEYSTLESFSVDYPCICDLFVKQENFIYKFEDKNWIEYLLKHSDTIHKVKIDYQGKITIFQISAVKSEKHQRFIISMFDISENEQINLDLQKQKNKALAATQAKGDFLANMSHEIRTPLNAILGFIDLLKEKVTDDESRQYLDTIDSSSYSLLGVINDILDFSKIESGKLDIDKVNFKPLKEFNNLADLFKARCTEKNISLKVDISSDLPKGLKADVLRIKQVVSNLLSNAIKFTEPNKKIIFSIDYSKGNLSCSIQDQGIGMSAEAQNHIFEAFTQAETSTTRKYGGTGLGLAISAKLVKILGGELKLESELNKGSLFYFSIPAKQVEIIEDDTSKIDLNQFFDAHILLVEDNKVNQMLMSALLRKHHITFDLAEDGLEAIASFKTRAKENSKPYDMILMDENMPNLNGIEATKQIRLLEKDLEEKNHTPIIALTANAMTGDRERFLQAGMDEYTTKPIKRPRLLEIFTQFLS